jgi:hypothetical protein
MWLFSVHIILFLGFLNGRGGEASEKVISVGKIITANVPTYPG